MEKDAENVLHRARKIHTTTTDKKRLSLTTLNLVSSNEGNHHTDYIFYSIKIISNHTTVPFTDAHRASRQRPQNKRDL